MLSKEKFITEFRTKFGQNTAYSLDELYGFYQDSMNRGLDQYKYVCQLLDIINDFSENDQINVYKDVRTWYAEKGIEMTPAEVIEWMTVLKIARSS